MLIELTDEELGKIRHLRYLNIFCPKKAGLYSQFNAVAKKIDKETDNNGE